MSDYPKYLTHTLANGATVVTMSPHGFKFSDGTESVPQLKEFCDYFTLKKKFEVVRQIKGMNLTSTSFVLSINQLEFLRKFSLECDLVLTPFQFLQAVQSSKYEYDIPNLVAFNSTPETARSAPQDKIVDINNWSVICP